jgi:DNA-binding GntR family transcriptional regulator
MHQKLKRGDPLYEQVYQTLEEAILEGRMTSGERLIDTKIATEFGVSRSPVREAFRKLEGDGLLINNEGIVTVITPSLQDVLELYQVRIGLESVAVYWATQYITKEELEELKHYLLQTEIAIEQKNKENIIALNTKFHESIVSFCGNYRLKNMMNNIRSLTRLFRNTIIKQYNRSDTFLLEHYEIYKAMSMKEPELAAKKMEQHIYKDMNHFSEFYLYEHKNKRLITKIEEDETNEYIY